MLTNALEADNDDAFATDRNLEWSGYLTDETDERRFSASLAAWASRSIWLNRRRWHSGGVGVLCVGIDRLLEVAQDSLHYRRDLSLQAMESAV